MKINTFYPKRRHCLWLITNLYLYITSETTGKGVILYFCTVLVRFLSLRVILRPLQRNVRATGCLGENAHAAVNRKCRLRLLDVPPLPWLAKLNKESSFCLGWKSVGSGVASKSATAAAAELHVQPKIETLSQTANASG